MSHYRVYKLAEPNGRIVKGKDIHAADDREAIEKAEQDEECPTCEVWRGTKQVGSVD